MLEELLFALISPRIVAGAAIGVVVAGLYAWAIPSWSPLLAAALFGIPFLVGVIVEDRGSTRK